MKSFNVIIERNGEFKPYDIMPYLVNTWYEFLKKVEDFGEEPNDLGEYWNIPNNFGEYRSWVDRELRYMYWSRCEYEIVLSQWPNPRNESGRKIDIYWQCQMNLDLITEIFISIVE